MASAPVDLGGAGVRNETVRQLRGCGPTARCAAEIAAMLGRTFSFDHVAAMLQRTPSELLGPVDELRRAGLVVEESEHLSFRDDLVRQALIDTVPKSARAALWRQAIGVLVRAGDAPGEVACQLARCARPGDRRDHDALTTAARALARCDPERAAALDERALELLTAEAEMLLADDRVDEAIAWAAEEEANAEHAGRVREAEAWREVRGRALARTGELALAATVLTGSIAALNQDAARSARDAAVVAALGRTAIHRSEPRLARRLAAVARRAASDGGSEVGQHLRWWLAWYALAAGDAAEAHATLLECGVSSLLPTRMADPVDPVALARLGLAAGDRALVDEAVAVAEANYRSRPTLPLSIGVSAQTRGLVARDPEQLALACGALDRSAHALGRASAREDLGCALLAFGDREGGIEALGRSLVTYTEAGASWDADRVRQRLRTLGVRRRLIKPTRPGYGWDALTDAELRVAQLVADGLKNREVAERLFVSPHTVSMHLRHAFTKLDINSRVELARLVDAHDRAA